MKRKTIAVPRKNWMSEMESVGFTYHTINGEKYWTEDAYYEFTAAQVEKIESVTKELSDMCFAAVDYVIKHNLFSKLKLSEESAELIRRYWDADAPTLYGRFDLGWNGVGEPKMYEYNADTPTSLMEASIAQYYWKMAYFPEADQFNSIHETLVEQFRYIKSRLPVSATLHVACVDDSEEDKRTTNYIADAARAAGLPAKFITMSDIGHNAEHECFVDMDNERIEHMFKLYPWEWMEHEDFAQFAFRDMKTWLEPVWKMVLSNKAILPILWKMYPNHPNLLEAYFDEVGEPKIVDELGNARYVRKPIYSREGANIELHNGIDSVSSDGEYGEEGHIIQELYMLPNFGTTEDPKYPVIGSWVVGDTPCGMGVREDNSPITKNTSHFLPHIFR